MEFTFRLDQETDKALGVTKGIGHPKVYWLPKSQVEEIDREKSDGNVYITLEIPEWLVKEKGFDQ